MKRPLMCLVVITILGVALNDLKQGQRKGAIALWIGPGTIAHFANLRVSR
jgi:hypothetical protein